MFGGESIMVWGCFSHGHKRDLAVVRQTTILTISFSLLCTHIS